MKNKLITLLYTIITGVIAGIIIWSFIKTMNTSIYYLWEYLPNKINFKYYTLTICPIFGIIIGIWKSKFGPFPEELEDVIKKIKKDGRYEYKNLKSSILSAILPLISGASIGPESGLTGIIASLCTWAGDKLKKFWSDIKELTNIGVSATLGTIFSSPLFGFTIPLEDEEITIPKTSKTILYFTSIISSFTIFTLLNKIFGENNSMENIGNVLSKNINYLHAILLCLIGIILSLIYFISKKLIIKIMKPLENHIIIKCTLGGLILGIIGTILPLTMFSGEKQISIIIEKGGEIGIIILLLTGIIKIILTNICIESGLKGGHFFPLIFSGLSVGYAFSTLLNIDPVLSMAIVTTSLLSNTLKKPLTTVLLLMIVFPPKLMIIMIGVSMASSFIKIPIDY